MELSMPSGTVWGLTPRDADGAHVTLEPREVLSLAPRPRGFRVVCGRAWITWRGTDIVLGPGETIRFARGGGYPVLSSAGRGRVTVELLA